MNAGTSSARGFLDLLYDESPRAAFDDRLAALEAAGVPDARREHEVALRVRETLVRRRAREVELSALYDTAHDLTALRDVDAVLTAIVRRARQLLNADMTYLSLNDEAEGASYMRVTDGALTQEFAQLRLPLGTGLLGLVAQTGAPYFTEDYQADARFLHRGYIDEAVAGEHIRAILGVPLMVDGEVTGALLAVHRSVRRFPTEEISLLTSFAAHAAVALENARLFGDLDAAHREMTVHTASVERAAQAHDRLTELLLHGGGQSEVATVLAELLGAEVALLDPDGTLLAGREPTIDWRRAVAQAVRSGHAVEQDGGWVAAALAGAEHVASLVLHPREQPLAGAEVRTLERGALVTALVLLFDRRSAETEERLGAELLSDLLESRDVEPTRLRERLRHRGLTLESPVSVVTALVDGIDRHPATRLAARVAARHGGLSGEHRGRVVVAASGVAARTLGERLRAALSDSDVTVGCAESADRDVAEGVRGAYAESRRGLDALVALGRRGEVADARGLGLARLLLGDNGPDEVGQFLEDTVGAVVEWDRTRGTALVETLEAWFAQGGGLKATAATLHVHPNTVVQRLERIGELLGSGWRAPERALDLQLALHLRRLHP